VCEVAQGIVLFLDLDIAKSSLRRSIARNSAKLNADTLREALYLLMHVLIGSREPRFDSVELGVEDHL
jgi:hypothetical protein